MTGTEKIKAKILEDARLKAQAVEEEAAEEARWITDEAVREAGYKKEAILKKAESDGAETYRRLLAVAGLEGRKEILRAKQDMVDAAFKSAMEKVIGLPDREYQNLLEGMAVKAATRGTGELLLSEKDLLRMDNTFIDNINRILISKGMEGSISLSAECIQTAGGFVLKCGDMEVNNTFEILFDMLRPELENEVVKILFST